MRVDIGGGTRLFFDVVGAGLEPTPEAMVERPTLLLLHGGPGGDHSSCRPFFDRFADTHQVVYVDHRGQGRSDGQGDPDSWNLDTWADDVVRFCDALGITRPVVHGLSFGSFVAIRYAARHPEHASKLILASTAARRYPELNERYFAALGGPEAAASFRRVFVEGDVTAESMIDYFTINMPLYNRVPSGFGPQRTRLSLEVFTHFMQDWIDMNLSEDIGRISVPTLVLSGRNDPITPHECATEVASLLSAGLGRLELFDDCGHGAFRDQPERTEAVLREFLA